MGHKNSKVHRGGRKTLREEVLMHDVINLSWQTLKRALVSNKLSWEDKVKVASQIAPKAIPKDIKINGGQGFTLNVLNYTPNDKIDTVKDKGVLEPVEQPPKSLDNKEDSDNVG